MTLHSLTPHSLALAAILDDVSSTADDAHHIEAAVVDTVLAWDYGSSRPASPRWSVDDLPWDTDVDVERLADAHLAAPGGGGWGADLVGTVFAQWTDREWRALAIEGHRWAASQFLHGEQAALVGAARLLHAIPSVEAKLLLAGQIDDEARHTTVFARYLDTKLLGGYAMNSALTALVDDVFRDGRWDITCLCVQVLAESMALAAFGFARQLTDEPLLNEIVRKVTADELRHVEFGVVTLADLYRDLSAGEIEERQRLAFEITVRTHDRFVMQEVFDRMGVPARDATRLVAQSPDRALFQHLVLARVVPICSRIGLLDAGDGWLRQAFTAMGVIGFEHADLATREVVR